MKELLEVVEHTDNEPGLYYYKLSSGFDRDMINDLILISRKYSRGLIDAINDYQQGKENSICHIVGAPIIGKTRSLGWIPRGRRIIGQTA